jgi:murein DD-endopeptidase MepM/ murein hydrolase activator NlpD
MRSRDYVHSGLDGLFHPVSNSKRVFVVVAAAVAAAAVSLGIAEAAVRVSAARAPVEKIALTSGTANAPVAIAERVVWEGADLDGDGKADVANPTGQQPREHDAYGEGRFHASRDGGGRTHEGVDYVATPGQTVEAPISGYVAKIGFAYPGDASLRYVEIENPALHMMARVFYVDPDVAVGDTVAVGHPIGEAHSLQRRYRHGITDHVHLELIDGRGRRLDAEKMITARLEPQTQVQAAD